MQKKRENMERRKEERRRRRNNMWSRDLTERIRREDLNYLISTRMSVVRPTAGAATTSCCLLLKAGKRGFFKWREKRIPDAVFKEREESCPGSPVWSTHSFRGRTSIQSSFFFWSVEKKHPTDYPPERRSSFSIYNIFICCIVSSQSQKVSPYTHIILIPLFFCYRLIKSIEENLSTTFFASLCVSWI